MDDEALMQAFESGQEPAGGFHHAQHVRVAWRYLCLHPLRDALERFRTGLRHFATVNGSPERYHETITTAYVLLIHDRLETCGRTLPWDVFGERNPDLLSWTPSILDRYYTGETLWSDEARRTFVMPDRDASAVSSWQRSGLFSSGQRTHGARP